MPLGYITIPRASYAQLRSEIERGVEVCDEVGALRVKLNALIEKTRDKSVRAVLQGAVESCEKITRLRVELFALERSMLELDQEITPYRPASQQDIKAAFENASDFATGKRKIPRPGG